MKQDIIINLIAINRIIAEQYEQLYTNKLDHIDEMDNFLERHKLLKMTQ